MLFHTRLISLVASLAMADGEVSGQFVPTETFTFLAH
jgi:hypothetical protein